MNEISELSEDYRAAWLSEYTPHRLRAALLQWDHEYDFWSGIARQISKLRSGLHERDALPALESLSSGSH